MSRMIFVNLPVRDLVQSKAFFAALGFSFNPQFTDASAACMILSEQGYVMLLSTKRFEDFAKKPIGDSTKITAGIYALSADSRADVDKVCDAAMAHGATDAGAPMDMGFMYQRSFYDLDGHHWEVLHMDMAQFPKS